MVTTNISVDFQHWRVNLTAKVLARYGSPHFDDSEVARVLSKYVVDHAILQSSHSLNFDPDHILCANEAFPEAAVTDPLGDLEVWDEWRSGTRVFPYEGKFARLAIRTQEPKTQSPSSIGVLGEIMAGIFAQAGIAPWVLARVVRRWPDFIFHVGHRHYAFVESKAFTELTNHGYGSNAIFKRINSRLLGECMRDAVRQLNADGQVTVWGAFTQICSVNPLYLSVTFLEIQSEPSHYVHSNQPTRLPAAVEEGLAQRALLRAAYQMEQYDIEILNFRAKARSERRSVAEAHLVERSYSELADLLSVYELEDVGGEALGDLHETIRKFAHHSYVPDFEEGRRFFEARERTAGEPVDLRLLGGRHLFVVNLIPHQRDHIDKEFAPNWGGANQPWGSVDSIPIWRCGGSAFGLRPSE